MSSNDRGTETDGNDELLTLLMNQFIANIREQGGYENEIQRLFVSLPELNMEKKSFKALKEMKKESTEVQKEEDQCTICLDKVNRQVDLPEDHTIKPELKMEASEYCSTVIVMPCNHRFHMSCLTLWLEKQQTCPTCRSKVKSDGEYEEEERQQRVDEIHDSMFS